MNSSSDFRIRFGQSALGPVPIFTIIIIIIITRHGTMMASLSSVPLPELVRTVLLESENPTYVFLRILMPPEMAGDKPSNECFLQLKIPVAIIHASARRGRKWLLYVATAIAGTHGHLRQDGKDLQSEDMQGPVVENDIYEFVPEGQQG